MYCELYVINVYSTQLSDLNSEFHKIVNDNHFFLSKPIHLDMFDLLLLSPYTTFLGSGLLSYCLHQFHSFQTIWNKFHYLNNGWWMVTLWSLISPMMFVCLFYLTANISTWFVQRIFQSSEVPSIGFLFPNLLIITSPEVVGDSSLSLPSSLPLLYGRFETFR